MVRLLIKNYKTLCYLHLFLKADLEYIARFNVFPFGF